MQIIVRKKQLVLEVWRNGKLEKGYPIAVGRNPGHKEAEADLRTPEGEYIVCVKNPKSKYHLSLGLNYPNNRDAEAAFKKGVISQQELAAITEANNAGKTPPWKTALGGEIFIHGHLEKQDWTHGCVRMNDPDIEALYNAATIGTKVTILS